MTVASNTGRGGRRVLVTGASRGIGRAVAMAFAVCGDRVALLSRASPELDATARACAEHAAEVVVLHADVTDEEQTRAAATYAIEQLGGLDVLVNNAGVGLYAPFGELPASAWEEMLRVNVLGTANVVRNVLPTMLGQRDGQIINIGSIRGIETIGGTTAYAASKFAVVGFTQALRRELAGSGVRVSLVAPGGVRTDFGQIPAGEKDENFLPPDVVAETVVAMVSQGQRAWVRDVTIVQHDYT